MMVFVLPVSIPEIVRIDEANETAAFVALGCLLMEYGDLPPDSVICLEVPFTTDTVVLLADNPADGGISVPMSLQLLRTTIMIAPIRMTEKLCLEFIDIPLC
jgi:hypothetical protein